MSTEFVSTTTNELAFVRWCHTSPDGHRTSFEFGTISNFEACCDEAIIAEGYNRLAEALMLPTVPAFEPLGGSLDSDPEFTKAGIEAMVASGRATFGEFPITVAVGSGDMFRFTFENEEM